MAAARDFQDHCWKDVVPQANLTLDFYAHCMRDTFVGPNPALLCIDLNNSACRAGPHLPAQIEGEGPGT